MGGEALQATMTNNENSKKTALSSRKTVKQAISFLSEKRIPMTPDNYRIWYDYFKNDHEEIRKELDDLLNKKSAFTPAVMEGLYKRHYTRDLTTEARKKLATEIKATQAASKRAANLLANALKEIINSSQSTSGYGDKLQNYLTEIESAEKIEDIGDVLSLLVKDTAEATKTNDSIREKLLKSSQQLSQLGDELAEAKKEAHTDNLTQLGNRRHFDEKLIEHFERNSTGKACSLMMLDIDYFKKFNDTYGHLMGDRLLTTFGMELKQVLPKEAIPCRYGGEEFAVILHGSNLAACETEAEKIRKAIDKTAITVRGKAVSVTLSTGVTELISGDTAETAIGRADKALYHAKENGRNQVHTE